MINKHQALEQKLAKIKLLVTDVDGVLTDGFIFITGDHEEPFGKFSILDGFAIIMANECGLKLAVISGRKSLATEARCYKLGIDIAYTGIIDKKSKLLEIAQQLKLNTDEIAYMGDDIIDLPAMMVCGINFAPLNAVEDVKIRADYITTVRGGNGALREVIEMILRKQNKYDNFLNKYLIV